MACKCRTAKTDKVENYDTMPDEPCIYCAEKHFSTALRLAMESGYENLNRQHIIGELVLAQWHLEHFNRSGAMAIRNIRHIIQNRQEDKAVSEWRKIGLQFDRLIRLDLDHGIFRTENKNINLS